MRTLLIILALVIATESQAQPKARRANIGVGTVAMLRTLNGQHGQQATTAGRIAINDGKASRFRYDSSITTTQYPDDGINYIYPSGQTKGAWIVIRQIPTLLLGYGVRLKSDSLTVEADSLKMQTVWGASNLYQPKGNYLTGITSAQISTALGYTPLSPVDTANKVQGKGNYKLATDSGRGATNYVTGYDLNKVKDSLANLLIPVYNHAPARALNTSYQLSTTKNTRVSYTLTHTVALTLVLTSGSSMAYLEISPNNSTWTTISQAGYSDGVAVAVALTKTVTNNVQGEVPAGYYVRIRTVTSGAGAISFTNGQEVNY